MFVFNLNLTPLDVVIIIISLMFCAVARLKMTSFSGFTKASLRPMGPVRTAPRRACGPGPAPLWERPLAPVPERVFLRVSPPERGRVGPPEPGRDDPRGPGRVGQRERQTVSELPPGRGGPPEWGRAPGIGGKQRKLGFDLISKHTNQELIQLK